MLLTTLYFQVVAVGYAIMTTRSVDLDWKMRAVRVMPMFVLPALSTFIYSALVSYTKMSKYLNSKLGNFFNLFFYDSTLYIEAERLLLYSIFFFF